MQLNDEAVKKWLAKDLMDLLIRLGIIAFLVYICIRIFEPFMALMLWALILAVALYPIHQRLASRLGGHQGRAATLIVLCGLLLIGGPLGILGGSFANRINDMNTTYQEQGIKIKQADPAVADWPIVGKRIYQLWNQAARDLPALLEEFKPQLERIFKFLLGMAASTAGDLLKFLLSLIVAGIMMAYGQSGSLAMQRIICRLAGPKTGGQLHTLSTATIRSVAVGVIGVAFIQALLMGIGFVWAGVPAAGVLAVIALLMGIAQLPGAILSLPVIGYIWWSGDSTLSNVFFTIYLVVAGMADNFLKPLLLGRGVDAPMPVILLGALGGMVTSGIMGLFIGAVLLGVGYQIFMAWVEQGETPTDEKAEAPVAETTNG